MLKQSSDINFYTMKQDYSYSLDWGGGGVVSVVDIFMFCLMNFFWNQLFLGKEICLGKHKYMSIQLQINNLVVAWKHC